MSSRRDFLHHLTASVMAVPALSFPSRKGDDSSTNDKPQQPMLRVALMGLGSYATRVAEAMQSCKMAKITGLISGTPSKIISWRKKYDVPEKNCYDYENFDQVKNNPDIDAVYVITPNALHHGQVIRAAK